MVTSTAQRQHPLSTRALTLTTDKSTWANPNATAHVCQQPDPIGVGQTGTSRTCGLTPTLCRRLVTNDIRRHNYTLTITAPDGTTETDIGTAIQLLLTQQANNTHIHPLPSRHIHILKFDYGGQVFTWPGTYNGDIYSPSTRTVNWTVQQETFRNP